MQILKADCNINTPNEDVKLFFVQAWYSLIHYKSLDSHRVRCMNSLNIIKELQTLLLKPDKMQKSIDKDIRMVSEEALAILKSDVVVKNHFKYHLSRIDSLLQEHTKEVKQSKKINILSYYLKDFIEVLEKDYLNYLFDELGKSIFEEQDKGKIFHITSILISVLMDFGHSMEALFSFVNHILCTERNGNFRDRFNQLKSILSKSEDDYEIIFRLTGFSKYNPTISNLGDITFRKNTEKSIELSKDLKKFLIPRLENVVFATTTSKGLDMQAAGLKAKQKIDNILDLIRFEFEKKVIKIDERFIIRKVHEKEFKIFRISTQIPNPRRNFEDKDFRNFLDSVKNVLTNASIQEETRKKITSAFRFYRMGRDTAQYENKFINWWTALEYLVRTGDKGSIVDEVEKKLASALLLEYIQRHLKSYISACAFCGVDFGHSWISPGDFFDDIHDEKKWSKIEEQIEKYPILVFALKRFKENTKDEKSISMFLKMHEDHLRWHINRIWRMRCDIVHSAKYPINLTLLSANLEFYLKTLLRTILKFLGKSYNIESLEELFARIEHATIQLEKHAEDDLELFKGLLRETRL